MNVLAFDIETIPDVSSGRRLHNVPELSDAGVAEIMFTRRRQETNNVSDFLRPHLHRVVSIAVTLATRDSVNVWSLGEPDAPEEELVRRFFDGVERYTPTLVSWNGRGFDLPVLHYRALLHGVSAPAYWENGDNEQAFRWNNYLNRFHQRHTDLMDVLAGYEQRAFAPLDDLAVMLGLPGKMGMSGAQVWDCHLAGDIGSIRNYCETDALNTYLIYLRYLLLCGHLEDTSYQAACERVKQWLSGCGKPHLEAFLEAWNNPPQGDVAPGSAPAER